MPIFSEPGRRGRRALSVPEVYAKIDRMIDTRVELFRGVGSVVAEGGV